MWETITFYSVSTTQSCQIHFQKLKLIEALIYKEGHICRTSPFHWNFYLVSTARRTFHPVDMNVKVTIESDPPTVYHVAVNLKEASFSIVSIVKHLSHISSATL